MLQRRGRTSNQLSIKSWLFKESNAKAIELSVTLSSLRNSHLKTPQQVLITNLLKRKTLSSKYVRKGHRPAGLHLGGVSNFQGSREP